MATYLLFSGVDAAGNTVLYDTDGTNVTQLTTDSSSIQAGSQPVGITVGSDEYLVLSDSTGQTTAIWQWNGTTLTQITPSTDFVNNTVDSNADTTPYPLASFQGNLVFSEGAASGTTASLAIYNTTTGVTTTPTVPNGGLNPQDFVTFNGDLYFIATDDSQSNSPVQAVYSLNGTTGLVSEIYVSRATESDPGFAVAAAAQVEDGLTVFNGNLFFGGGQTAIEKLTINAGSTSATASQFNNFSSASNTYGAYQYAYGAPSNVVATSSLLFDANSEDGVDAVGTGGGNSSNVLGAIGSGNWTPAGTLYNGNVIFIAYNANVTQQNLYETNGTSAATILISNFSGSDPFVVGNTLYYNNNTDGLGTVNLTSDAKGAISIPGSTSQSPISGAPIAVLPFTPTGFSVGSSGPAPTPPTVSVDNVTQNDSSNFTFDVTLSAASLQTVTVNYATADGTAHAGTNYTATSGTVTFTPGQTTQTVTVTIQSGSLTSPQETFTLNLSSPNNATIGTGTGTGTIEDTPPTVSSLTDVTSTGTSDLKTGATVTFTLTGDKALTVGAGATLTLSNGTTATYTSGSGTTAPTFTYTVASGHDTSDLKVTGYSGSIADKAGVSLVASGVTEDTGVQIDTTAPTVSSLTDVTSTGTSDLKTGATVTFTLDTSENVNATGSTLTLSNGATAAYTSGTGTAALTYTYTVANGQDTSDLKVTGYGGSIADGAGNALVASGVTEDTGVQIDTTAPTVSSLTDVTSTGTSDLKTGATVTFTLDTSENVNATGSTLTLSNGATAAYTSGTGTAALTYTYTVANGQDTSDLKVTGYGGSIADGAGNALVASGVTEDTGVQIDTTAPTITAVADSGPGVAADGSGDLGAGKTVTFTATTDEPVSVTPAADGSTPTVSFNDGGTATYTGPIGTATTTLTFSYVVASGQNTAALQLMGITGAADVTDAAGNPIDLSSLGTATFPTGALTIDTTPPVVSSPTLAVGQNAGPTAIGIAAPSDNLTAAGNLAIAVSTLPSDGVVTLDGTTPVAAGEMLTAAQLENLDFTPTAGVYDQASTFTYTVTDGAGNATRGTATLDVGSPGAPTVTGTHASSTAGQVPVAPFSGVAVADPSAAAGATETLRIALSGGGGTLADGAGYGGLVHNADGSYTLSGAPGAVTQELDALSFTPAAPAPGTSATTQFTLTDTSSSGTSVQDGGTRVTDAADAVSISRQVAFTGDGNFTLTVAASSTVPVTSVEVSADVDGVETDLGPAVSNGDGTFTFTDHVGAHLQGFITATETDAAGGKTSTTADFSLQAGIRGEPYVAQQDRYSADGSTVTGSTEFRRDGTSTSAVSAPGQSVTSQSFDVFDNHRQAGTTFVFNPGFGIDVVKGFVARGPGHDVIDLPASDFTSVADVLRNTGDIQGSAWITDPKTGDAIRIAGVTTAALAHHPKDFAFHA